MHDLLQPTLCLHTVLIMQECRQMLKTSPAQIMNPPLKGPCVSVIGGRLGVL